MFGPSWEDMMADLSRAAIAAALFSDETELVQRLAAAAALAPAEDQRVAELARNLVTAVRAGRRAQGSIDSFMQEFSLSEPEGLALMCLAEALIRVPDAITADLRALLTGGWLAGGAVVVLERSARGPDTDWPDGYDVWRCKRYGETQVEFADVLAGVTGSGAFGYA